jgi:hypothetical protein
LRFPKVLLGHDRSEIPLNPPRKIATLEAQGLPEDDQARVRPFNLDVGENGLRGVLGLF